MSQAMSYFYNSWHPCSVVKPKRQVNCFCLVCKISLGEKMNEWCCVQQDKEVYISPFTFIFTISFDDGSHITHPPKKVSKYRKTTSQASFHTLICWNISLHGKTCGHLFYNVLTRWMRVDFWHLHICFAVSSVIEKNVFFNIIKNVVTVKLLSIIMCLLI